FAYGVLAAQAGLSPWEAGAMSLLVYAGASQFIAVGMLAADAGLAAVAATTFLVNLRHLLMSAALSPYFHRVRRPLLTVLSFFVTDESFAVSSTVFAERGRGDAGWFAGLAVTAYGSWLAASVAGALAGGAVDIPAAFGLDFALTGMFIGLLDGGRGGRGVRAGPGALERYGGRAHRGRGGGGDEPVDPQVLLIIAAMALVTYIPRMAPMVVLSGRSLPPVVMEWLGLLPASLLG